MNQIVKQEVNIKSLIQNSKTIVSLNIQSKLIERINEKFSEQEQQWYITNLYIYMNYHQTNDFVVNLENIYKMIGFANKANAKRTLKNNFVLNEDYKITILPSEKAHEIVKLPKKIDETIVSPTDENKIHIETRGRIEETVMLNVDTFKNLCMISKTDKG